MRRPSAIEPVIGHLKNEHRMDRNYLADRKGDANNAILAAVGYNFRRLIRWLRILLRIILAMLCANPQECLRDLWPKAEANVEGGWFLGATFGVDQKPCLPKTVLGAGILALARMRSQSSGVIHVMNELLLSSSAWLIESHWSSCRLPGKTNSSASRSGNHVARSGNKA
jgi:hypothetical protein